MVCAASMRANTNKESQWSFLTVNCPHLLQPRRLAPTLQNKALATFRPRAPRATPLVTALLALPILTQAADPSAQERNALGTFMHKWEQKVNAGRPVSHIDAFVDLNEDGKNEALVYITDRDWCGTGGCNLLILTREGSSNRIISEASITRPPIRVLERKSHGWRNISVWVVGGGIQPGYEAELRFDGKTYPGNPSGGPARRLRGKAAGRVVIGE